MYVQGEGHVRVCGGVGGAGNFVANVFVGALMRLMGLSSVIFASYLVEGNEAFWGEI